MRKNQKGFSVIEILIVIVVVGLIGIVGWLLYDRQNQKENETTPQLSSSQDQTTIKEPDATPKATDSTEGWKTVTSEKYHFSYKYPTTNECADMIMETDESSQNYELGERLNNSGITCIVSKQSSALPISVRVAATNSNSDQPDFGDKQMQGNTYYKLESKDTVMVSGVMGTRWHYIPADDRSADIFYYYFTYKDLGYVVIINDNGYKLTNYNVTDLGKSIFKTFKFL